MGHFKKQSQDPEPIAILEIGGASMQVAIETSLVKEDGFEDEVAGKKVSGYAHSWMRNGMDQLAAKIFWKLARSFFTVENDHGEIEWRKVDWNEMYSCF